MFDRTVLKAFRYYVRYVLFVLTCIGFAVVYPLGCMFYLVTRPAGYQMGLLESGLFMLSLPITGFFLIIAWLGGASIAKRGVIDVGTDLADGTVDAYQEKRRTYVDPFDKKYPFGHYTAVDRK